MFYLFAQLLQCVISPAVWLLALLLAALLARTPTGQRRWLRAAALAALIGTNSALANEALRAWELPPVGLAQLAPHDAAVLLTGITNVYKSPHDRVYLSAGADRFTNALWLYRAGKVQWIIISGGLSDAPNGLPSEARELATLLRLAGVPARALLLEERSRNTHENALYTRQLLAAHPTIKSLILITSAFHERRAMGCFRRVGLAPTAFPAGYSSTDRRPSLVYWLIPSVQALAQWDRLVHELVGYLAYRAAGYV